jgi:hypothetical protein
MTDTARPPTFILDEDLNPIGMGATPCPASVEAVLSVPEPVRLWCGELEGHEPPHRFHIEWTDPT